MISVILLDSIKFKIDNVTIGHDFLCTDNGGWFIIEWCSYKHMTNAWSIPK